MPDDFQIHIHSDDEGLQKFTLYRCQLGTIAAKWDFPDGPGELTPEQQHRMNVILGDAKLLWEAILELRETFADPPVKI